MTTELSIARTRVRAVWLIAASLALFAWISPAFALLFAATTLVDRALAHAAARDRSRRLAAVVSAVMNLGAILALHNLHRFADVLAAWPGLMGAALNEGGTIAALPIGWSLLFAQNLAHVLAIAGRRATPTECILDHSLAAVFFPRMWAGPMVDPGAFARKIRTPARLAGERRGRAIWHGALGAIKIVAVADYLALNMVDKVFDLPTLFSTTEVIFALFANALVFAALWSGACDIAVAVGLLLGFDLPDSFASPAMAKGPRDYWRRFLAPLTSALRDAVYRPLAGGPDASRIRRALAAFAPPLLVGVVVGPSETTLAFGAFVGATLFVAMLISRKNSGETPSFAARAIGWLLTFLAMTAAWTLWRAHDLQTVSDLASILPLGIYETPNLTTTVIAVFAAAQLAAFTPAPWVAKIRDGFARLPWPVQVAAGLVVAWLLWRVNAVSEVPFVYERM
ncbi:MAG: hypothetical protein IT350_03605 [Deltaproteobacteria bacterium]|nr:hypothetical protein [Deltaproteobacteria bacterium]